MKQIIVLFFVLFSISATSAQTGKYLEINALQADSLAKANTKNPKFVILDIRTPDEYNPKHIEGAINRNYYVTFDQKLDSLDKQKIYLLHCQAGSRSAGAFTKMKAKNFKEVYNLKGGIKDWINAGFPVTSGFAPLLMFVSDTVFADKQVAIGAIDTIKLKITNRANDTLKILSFSDLSNTKFTTDFNKDTVILGASDYAFNIFYTSTEESEDSLTFTITSNGGTKTAKIYRNSFLSGICDCVLPEILSIYPNPASDYLDVISYSENDKEYFIYDINGKTVKKHTVNNSRNNHRIDINDLKSGIYFIKEISGKTKPGAIRFIKN